MSIGNTQPINARTDTRRAAIARPLVAHHATATRPPATHHATSVTRPPTRRAATSVTRPPTALLVGTLLIVALLVGISLIAAPTVAAQGNVFKDTTYIDHETNDRRGLILYAHNTLPFPIYAHITTTQVQNYTSTVSFPLRLAIPPHASRQNIAVFEIIDKNSRSAVEYGYTLSFSDPTQARHDNRHLYLFPFAHGSKFQVGQTHNGSYSHFDIQNKYAIDFNMEIGTPIHAARDGTVVFVKQDSSIGGAGTRYGNQTNLIFIMHDDGSLASYAHLQRDGAQVTVGQQVRAGEQIGMSGNTGNSAGPHLHFNVQVPSTDDTMVSVPATFTSLDERVARPERGEYYYASHPNQRPFEVVLGRTLTPASFDDYIRSVDATGRIEFRSEKVDSTFVVFCVNGTTTDLTVEVKIDAVGLTPEIAYPLRTIIPTRSEIFCGLFQPQSEATRYLITPTLTVIQ